jgi:hypothetical protein
VLSDRGYTTDVEGRSLFLGIDLRQLLYEDAPTKTASPEKKETPMNPTALDETNLRIDMQLTGLWEVLVALDLAEKLDFFAPACRASYVRGYHDGDYAYPAGPADELDIDLRCSDIFTAVEAEIILDERDVKALVISIRAAYTRGYDEGAGDKPFGLAPRLHPNALGSAV